MLDKAITMVKEKSVGLVPRHLDILGVIERRLEEGV